MKIMKLSEYIAAVIFATMILQSCEKDVLLKLPGQDANYLIVEANINDYYESQFIRLYRANSFYDTVKSPPVGNAVITVSDGNEEYGFSESSTGYYVNNSISSSLITGHTYLLTVEDDGEIYTAKSELRPVPEIDSLTFTMNSLSDLEIVDRELYNVFIHFKNLQGWNYYLVNLFVNGESVTATPNRKPIIADEGFDGYASLFVRTFKGDEIKENDMVTLQLMSISREQYDFYMDLLIQTELSGNPFAGAPPANVPTNMSEGARGFFQVSSVSVISTPFRF
jgi:hypothetical protein